MIHQSFLVEKQKKGGLRTWENTSFKDTEEQTTNNQSSMCIYETLTHGYESWAVLATSLFAEFRLHVPQQNARLLSHVLGDTFRRIKLLGTYRGQYLLLWILERSITHLKYDVWNKEYQQSNVVLMSVHV